MTAVLTSAFLMTAGEAQEASFIRGNANGDSAFDITDAVCILEYLFHDHTQNSCSDAVSQCLDAADANDDGSVDIADVIKILAYLFGMGGALPPPFGECGIDSSDDGLGCIWQEGCNYSTYTSIALQGNSIAVVGSGVTVQGAVATITASGTYVIAGNLTDGQIVVDSPDGETVSLLLQGATIGCSTSSAILVQGGTGTINIVLEDGTTNDVTDGSTYSNQDSGGEPDAAVFSKRDLVIKGNGSLLVHARYKDGIKSKDGLLIEGGTIAINSEDDGLMGRDYVVVRSGNIAIAAGGDGMRATNDEDTDKGFIIIEDGSIDVTSGADAIQAETEATITGGEISITTAGGSRASIGADESAKGIKAAGRLVVDGGVFSIDSADDALHSNGTLEIGGGTFSLASADDAIHADSAVQVNGGSIYISRSYEGVESKSITINDGSIRLVSSDDGINTSDGSGAPSGSWPLYVHGGYIAVYSGGDGVDANGPVTMTGGQLIVHGPTENFNGPLDYASFRITGGFVVAAGSSGMAQAPGGNTSTQYCVLVNFDSPQAASTLFHIRRSDGTGILTFQSSKTYQSVGVSSAALTPGSTYNICTGGSATGTATDGVYEGGTYSGGTNHASFTITSLVTNIGRGGGPHGGP